MSLTSKPAEKPKFADSVPGTLIATPSGAKQDAGWAVEKPPVQYMNWIHKWTYKWLLFFENRIDALEQEYDVVVNSAAGKGTHDTLALALADVAVVAGMKVLVMENQTINTSALTVSKAVEIVFKPNVGIVKGTSATGLNITAAGTRIRGGKITGFIGAGDKGIVVDAAASRVKIGEVDFSGNETDVDDQNGGSAIYGCHFS